MLFYRMMTIFDTFLAAVRSNYYSSRKIKTVTLELFFEKYMGRCISYRMFTIYKSNEHTVVGRHHR